MKLLLIQPSHLLNGGQVYKPRWPWLPNLTMPTIAALTPSDVEVTIVDEYVQGGVFEKLLVPGAVIGKTIDRTGGQGHDEVRLPVPGQVPRIKSRYVIA